MEKHLFPDVIHNYQSTVSVNSDGIFQENGIFEAYYTDINLLKDTLGSPLKWNESYDNYYFIPDGMKNDMIIYIYSLSANCWNGDVCNLWIYGESTIFLQKWMGLAILFILLTLCSFCIIGLLLYKLGLCTSKARKGGYIKSEIGIETEIEIETETR